MSRSAARLGGVRVRVVTALVLFGAAAGSAQERPAAPATETLLERTLAIVGGAVVTQSDVTLAQTVGLLDGAAATSSEAALSALVDRWLMLHEVARFAPAEPAATAIEARLAAIRARAGDDAALTRALAAGGREPSYLTIWVRDDLRIAAYLEQRFASTGVPMEADVAAYASQHAAELSAAGVTGDAVVTTARTRLLEERRRDLIADWLADLRRRTPVVTFAARP